MASQRASVSVDDLLAHAGWLRRLARYLVRDGELADELTQEVWVATTARPPDAGRPPRPWLAEVLRNALRSRTRKERTRSRWAMEHHDPLLGETVTPEAAYEQLELHRLLVESVMTLDEPLRTTVLLRFFEDRSSFEIGRRMGVPAGTVRWRLKASIEKLRRDLDRKFGSRRQWAALLAPMVKATLSPTVVGGVILVAKTKASSVFIAAAAVTLLGGMTWFAARTAGGPSLKPNASPPLTERASESAAGQSVASNAQGRVRPSLLDKEGERQPLWSLVRYRGAVPYPSAVDQLLRQRTLWGQVVQVLELLSGEDPQTLGAIYEDEARHPEWASAMESLLRERFVGAGVDDVFVDCRQSTCRIDLEHPMPSNVDASSAKSPLYRVVRTTGPLASVISNGSSITEGPTGRIEHVRAFIAFSDAEIDPNRYLPWVRQTHQNWIASWIAREKDGER